MAGSGLFFTMAEQGQQYRILAPKGTRRTVIGQGESSSYVSSIRRADGELVEVVDRIGDVIFASKYVDYPRGNQSQYRHVDWIEQHRDRFELINED